MKNALCLYFLLSIISFDCEREGTCPDQIFNESSLKIDLTPEHFTYAIGDTIWLSSKFDTDLELTNKDEIRDVSDSEGSIPLLLLDIDSGSDISRGYSDFDIINVKGQVSQEGFNSNIKKYEGRLIFGCDSLSCEFITGIVPKFSGTYCVIMKNGNIRLDPNASCSEQIGFFKNSFTTSAFNREIYEEVNIKSIVRLPVASGSRTLELVDNDAAFAFKVE